MWQMIVRVVENNFQMVWETLVMLLIYIIGAIFIAKYGEPMLLTAWLSGGVAVGALVRAFQGNGNNNNGNGGHSS